MLFRSLPVKCSNNSGDLFGTFAAHSGLLVVRDVTDTECWAQIAALRVVFSQIDF